ncbi:MAG TPA: hypothetical protein VFJ99_00010, partial [Solirubrobacterales bacterium]|nr:hypothetical protein [Solirubrobacterales bacterium]
MIVEALELETLPDGRVARHARLVPERGEPASVRVAVPEGFAPPEADDATGPLPLALLLAMRQGEDLRLRGRVDSALLARVDDLQAHYLACAPDRLRPVAVEADGTLGDGEPGPLAAACFSRGVDSMYQAARRRGRDGPLEALLFVDRFEPVHDEAVRAREIELAGEAAAVLGLPLVLAEAPLRELADAAFDWEDAVGAGLAWVGHALSGRIGRLVIPSADSLASLGPTGASPALDPLLSSRRIVFEPGGVERTRMGKVEWIVANQPALLPYLKVCFAESREDNCGRCGKCLHTMACLRAAGALGEATGFPDDLDLDLVAREVHGLVSVLIELAAVRDAALAAGDGELAAALTVTLRRSAQTRPPFTVVDRPSFRSLHSRRTRDLLHGGVRVPEVELARVAEPVLPGIGLVRVLDPRGRRHVHGAGWVPAGQLTAELGALAVEGAGEVALWILPDGRLATAAEAPGGATRQARVLL